MHLIVGATGILGGTICELLRGQGKGVRALVRESSDPDRVAGLEHLGVELVVGDLKDRASLERACEGCKAIVSTATTIVSHQPGDSFERADRDGQLALVEAAEQAGVERFVFVSVGVGRLTPSTFVEAKGAVEERLRAGRLTYTILQPVNFMEIWLSPVVGFDVAGGRVRIYGDGSSRTSWISLGDVARFAVESLSNPAAERAVLPLGGPEALSYPEVVRIFEEVCGKELVVEQVPVEAIEQQLAAIEDPFQQTLTQLVVDVARRDQVVDMTETLERFPLRLTSVRDYAARVCDK